MESKTKYVWDLSKLCKDDADFEKKFKQAQKLSQQFSKFEGKLGNKQALFEYLTLDDQFDDIIEPVYRYVMANLSTDVSNAHFKGFMQQLEAFDSNLGVQTAFVLPELLSLSDQFFDDVINDPKFLPWRFSFLNLKKQKQHVLTKEQEQVVSALGPTESSAYETFKSCCYADINFGTVLDSLGKQHELTRSNYSKIMQNPDQTLRKNAQQRYFDTYEKHLNTLTTTLVSQVQKNICYAKLYKYPSVLDRTLFANNMDRSFYDNLLSKTLKFVDLNKNFSNLVAKLIKKQYNLTKLMQYDLGLPLGKKPDDISFEQLVELTKKSLQPLGEDYQKLVQRAIDERWVDVMPSKNKESGAWCADCYGTTPIIMLNFEGEVDDQFVHEVGHGIRDLLCAQNNPRSGTGSAIFIEETYSTVNQTFFARYLIDNAKDKNEKIYFLVEYLSTLFSYVVGSTTDSVVEDRVYQMVENNEPINKDIVLNFAKQQYQKTWTDEVLDRFTPVRTISMMHYYSAPYYVWQYACGQLNANFIVNKIQQNPSFVKKYFEFIKAGSMYPLDMLKLVDIDYKKDDVFDEFEAELKLRLAQLEELLN